ncbi:MAG: hypothetical protein LBS57_07145 [Treponema sp.]|jgi:hypothetical protein|nr:hypothetical protein [Treponema sp.]
MKKKLLCGIAAVFALALVLFFAGCPTEPEEEKKGVKWVSDDGTKSFVLYDDLTFSCYLAGSALGFTVNGRLDKSESGLGKDEYIMKDLRSPDKPNMDAVIKGTAEDQKVKLEYTADGSEFVLSSTDATVNSFFGGTFKKK